jgi:G:T/U-mismatch repair DNA glycosylase
MPHSGDCGAAAAAAAAAAVRPQIGHNPSEHAWHTGHYYSNPSNRMWRILEGAGRLGNSL